MPDPPQFVNYSSTDGAPLTSSASKVTSRPAQFSRMSQRVNRITNVQPQPDDEPLVNTAGVGSGNRAPNPNENLPGRGANLSRTSTRRQVPTANGNSNGPVNGISPSSSPTANSRHPIGNGPMTSSTQNELVGGHSQQPGSRGPVPSSNVGDEMDPMVQALTNLRTGPGAIVGRSGTRRVTAPDPSGTTGPSPAPPNKALTPPAPVSPQNKNVDYRNSAEFVVGVHPAAQAPPSRSTSPVPPTANFMQPPAQAPAPVVDAVIDSYHQSFPGERRSRSNSRRASFNAQHPVVAPSLGQEQSQGNLLERPVSRDGHPGIGANGRSRSPSINHPASRSTSPVPPGPARGGSVSRLDQGAGQGQYRATTPNSVGIALDPHGNVAMDAMADVYRQQQQQQQPVVQTRQVQQAQAPPPMQPPPPAPAQYQQPVAQPQQLQAPGGAAARPAQQRQIGVSNAYTPPASWQTQAPAPPPQQYIPPPPTQQPPHHSPTYVQAPHPYANAPPSQVYHTAQPGYGMQQSPLPPPQQPRQQTQHGAAGSNNGDYYSPTQTHQAYAQPHQQPRQQYPQHQHQHVAYGGPGYNRSLSPGPVNRSPSPQPMALTQPQPQPLAEPPTRQYTEDGRGVLFYGASFILFSFPPLFCFADRFVLFRAFPDAVRALYDYTATIPEEFDFQANDIIAVTATPEDGWWSGELLDENRRVPGRHIFPSNFVHLF